MAHPFIDALYADGVIEHSPERTADEEAALKVERWLGRLTVLFYAMAIAAFVACVLSYAEVLQWDIQWVSLGDGQLLSASTRLTVLFAALQGFLILVAHAIARRHKIAKDVAYGAYSDRLRAWLDESRGKIDDAVQRGLYPDLAADYLRTQGRGPDRCEPRPSMR